MYKKIFAYVAGSLAMATLMTACARSLNTEDMLQKNKSDVRPKLLETEQTGTTKYFYRRNNRGMYVVGEITDISKIIESANGNPVALSLLGESIKPETKEKK